MRVDETMAVCLQLAESCSTYAAEAALFVDSAARGLRFDRNGREQRDVSASNALAKAPPFRERRPPT